ncbi:RNA polymerase sigma factor [Homoserinimonas sp. OAct 916]|uniref:RNA polymerase sigma factor n=1 Tax=Homoserinimonas sp. OAct 916 TaxID=2211450 RepID=UPI000DBE96D7|nr:sigma-70 family RNA polymerase sigma factor [Homoserinimonas sp. OAct 916]
MTDVVADALATAASAETARIVSTLIRMTGDFTLAEDCLQDAFAKALVDWRANTIPANPGAWLTTVAKNRAVDVLRRAAAERRALHRIAREPEEPVKAEMPEGVSAEALTHPDDRLSLIFTCCHPALPMDARVALTLRTVAGLSPAQIARAFLVTESTMEKRLVRARAKIKNAGIPYRVPPESRLIERRDGVLAVLYLLFSAGYSATGDDSIIRRPLLAEAVRLTRLMVELLPADAEARGLLALMLLQHARSDARTDSAGELVTLENQDRSRWDAHAISEAIHILAGLQPGPGRYELQARIAACHATAASPASTNFEYIARLYGELAAIMPSPIVELNRAVAVAMWQGPDAGLAILATITGLDDYYLLHATRADLLRRLGRADEATIEYQRALELAPTDVERRYLARRMRDARQR